MTRRIRALRFLHRLLPNHVRLHRAVSYFHHLLLVVRVSRHVRTITVMIALRRTITPNFANRPREFIVWYFIKIDFFPFTGHNTNFNFRLLPDKRLGVFNNVSPGAVGPVITSPLAWPINWMVTENGTISSFDINVHFIFVRRQRAEDND